MAVKCIFRFENLDSTRDLNQRSEHLFKKGIYYGGKVTIEPSNVSTINVSPFRLISHDGMHVLSDSDILLPISIGEFYIVCRAKYVIDDSPDISVFSIDDSTFNSLSDEEKSYYVVFAHVSCDGISITDVNIKEYKEEITQIGRNSNRGYFESEQELLNIEAFEGDFATVKSDNSSEILPYIYNGTEWISFPNNRVFNVYLANHRTNKNVLVSNTLESVSDDKKNKGAYHINWNQLHSLKNFEFENGHEKISKTQSFYKKDYVQVIPLEYKAIKDANTDVSISGLNKVDNIGSLTEGDYFVDYDSCLVYAWTPSNSQTTTYEINYYYSYKEKLVVSEIEFNKIPRPSELDALKGNSYGINFINKAPSRDNPFITSNSPVPKTKIGTFNVETINNEYYLTTEETNIFIGDDNYKKYFEVLDLENGLPVYIDVVKVIDNGVVRNVDEENVNEYRNGWFIKRTNCKLALKIVNIGTFTANSLSDSKKVAYHVENGLGDIVEIDNIDYLTNQNNEKNLLKAKNITFDTLFNVDDDNELSINSASIKGINHTTKISTLLNSEIGFFYNNNKVGSIGTVRDNNESFLSIESIEDLNVLSHKDIFIESRYSQTKNSEISFEENESKFKVTKYNDYAQIKLIVSDSSITRTIIDSVSVGEAIVTISSNNRSTGPYIEVKNDENQSSLYNRGTIKLVSQRTINYIDYKSSIIESVSSIELKNSTDSNYSRYYSFATRILLENGEVETDNPDNTDTRKYSNVKIEKDSISLSTIYGTVTYSKYISENEKITIENGETETNDPNNSDTRKYSKIEIENNKISLNTIQGDVGNSIIELEDNKITMYSSNLVISSISNDANKYGIEIDNTVNSNKGIMIVTSNPPNYVHLNDDFVKLSANDVSNITARENGISLEFIDSSNSSYLRSTYNTSGFKTEAYDTSSKADASLSKSLIYLSTYSSNFSIPDSSIELNRTLATIYVGNNSQFKVTDSYIESKVNTSYIIVSDSIESKVEDSDGSKTISLQRKTTSISSSILNFAGTGIVLSHAVSSYSNAISLNDTLNLISNNCVSINCSASPNPYITNNSVSINSDNKILLTSGTYIGNATVIDIDKTRYTTNVSQQMTDPSDNTKSITVTSFIDINETNDAVPLKYTAIGISQTYQGSQPTESIKLLMSNNPNSEVEIDSVHQLYTSGKMTVTIGSNSYWVVLCKIPTA